jgi:hypothetical protein
VKAKIMSIKEPMPSLGVAKECLLARNMRMKIDAVEIAIKSFMADQIIGIKSFESDPAAPHSYEEGCKHCLENVAREQFGRLTEALNPLLLAVAQYDKSQGEGGND